jgi:RNA polymerase sigma-70 factor, ECF subfamily
VLGKTGARPDAEREMSGATVSFPMVVRPVASVAERQRLDPESTAWLADLAAKGRAREQAIARLHTLLLRAARFTLARRRGSFPHLRGNDFDDIALEAADDALVALLNRLSTFRGDSRFSTWAWSFAVLEASVKLRRLAWQGRELPLAPEGWLALADERMLGPAARLEQRELLGTLRELLDSRLTGHQRAVLVAITLEDVPIDVLAERLGTTRGALYKTLHDARGRLRAGLAERGLDADTIWNEET